VSSLFGSPKTTTVRYTQINLSTSSQGVPIAIGWGRNRASNNIVWYNNFQSVASAQSAGGKGGGGGATSYNYSVACILALGEGPINSVITVWSNKDVTTLAALNLTPYLGSATQTSPSWITSNYPSQAVSYADTAYLFSSKYALGSSPDLPSHNFEVSWYLDSTVPGYIDANFADIIPDFCTNPRYGIGLPSSAIDTVSLGSSSSYSSSSYWTYCAAAGLLASPLLNSQEQGTNILQRWAQLSNTFIFFSGGQLKFVPLGDSIIVNGSYTYTPNLTSVYSLGLDDFIVKQSGDLPVTVTRSDALDRYNRVQLDYLDRSNFYNNASAQWQDQTSVDLYGQLQAQVISATEICTGGIAATMATLIGQRSVWIRNQYKFTLGYNYLLLEVGDLVDITEPMIGLSGQHVRIISIEETAEQLLDITAEEFNAGVGTVTAAVAHASGASGGYNALAAPGNVNTPVIFEPPAMSYAGTPQLWFGCSGGPNWGGARIYVSFDGGANYAYLASVYSGEEQGVLTASMPTGTYLDTTSTVSADLTMSQGNIPSGATHADAQTLRTMILVDSELMAYGASSLGSSAYHYNMSYLYRGLYGTSLASHAVGAPFLKFDNLFTYYYNVPAGYASTTLYFKFLSFNNFGNALQDLASVSAYTHTMSAYSGGTNPGPGGSGTGGGGGGSAGGDGPGGM